MADIITNIIQDKQDVKNQLGTVPDVISSLQSFNQQIFIRPLFTKQFVINPNDSFVLGSATNAILGTTALGDRRTEDNSFVFPAKNIVEEDLYDAQFIDEDNTTATLGLDGTVTFADGEVLVSDVVAKIRTSINSLKVTDLNTSGGSLAIEYSIDGGSNWSSITLGERLILTGGTSDDALVYRLTATGAVTLTGPIKIQVNQ